MKSVVRFSDKPSPIFENINAFIEGSSYMSDSNNADLTIDNIDRKNFAGVTPHAIKLEATKNMNLFKQSLIVPEYPMSQSFDTSVNQDKLQSYLGFADSPSTSVNISIPNNCINTDLSELQSRLANNLMWNSVDNLQQENEKLTPTAASKIIEPFPDFSVKHVIQHHDENCNPNVLKPTSSVKSKTSSIVAVSSSSDKSIAVFSANKTNRSGLTSPLKSSRRKVSTIALTPKNPVKIYNDSLIATVRTNQSTNGTTDITTADTNYTPKASEKDISPKASEVNTRHSLLPCSESPIANTPVAHNESMSFHSSPAIPPFSVSESSKSNSTSNNDNVIEDSSNLDISGKCNVSSSIMFQTEMKSIEQNHSQPVNTEIFSGNNSYNTTITTITVPQPSIIMNSSDEKVRKTVDSSYAAPISYGDVYSQELNGIAAIVDSTKNSTATTIQTITSSVTKLGRQGGVALGKGPRIMINSKHCYANAIDMNHYNNAQTENSFDSSMKISHSLKQAKRVLVSRAQNSPGSVIAKIPERSEATKVDRKKLAFPVKSKKTHIASSTATLLAQSIRDLQPTSRSIFKESHRQDMKALGENKTEVESIVSNFCCGSGSNSIESCLTSEDFPNRSEKHNIIIQCDSFLLSESNKQHTNKIPQSLKIKSVTTATNTSNDDISYDYSAISSDLSQKVTPQINNGAYKHHTPMFHSYYKNSHDSDSEDNIEHGLEEYLSTASSIAALHSFDDAASALKGFDHTKNIVIKERVQTQPWNHSFCEENKPWKDIALSKSKRNSFRSSATQNIQSLFKNYSFARTSSSSSVLGSAQRVCTTKSPLVSSTRLPSNHKVLDSYTSSSRYNNTLLQKNPIEYQEVDYQNTTVLTDAATAATGLVPNDDYCSQLMSRGFHNDVLDYSMNSVDITKAETTLTLDHRHPLDVSLSPEAHALHTKKGMECGPRLAILPLKREKGAVEDIKEINFRSFPGEQTTIALTISNHRNKTIRMNAHAVSLRFEEISSSTRSSIDTRSSIYSGSNEDGSGNNDEGKDIITVETTAPASSFEVYPGEINILPGTEGLLYVTFNPMKLSSGVYSGAIKIRSHRKSFILLLRGEAYYNELKENLNVHNNVNNNTSIIVKDNKQLLQRIKKLKTKSSIVQVKNTKVEETLPKENAGIFGIPLLNDSKKQIIPSKSIEKLSLNPIDSLLLQKSLHTCNRYEAYINATISLNDVEISNTIELNMKSSVSFLKLSKSQVVLSHNHNNESVKVILDENVSQLLDLCNKILSFDPSVASTILIGFIMIETSMKCEYTIDVNLTRSACFLIQQQHQQQTRILKSNTEKKIAFSTNKYSNISTPTSSSMIQSLQDCPHNTTIASHLNNTTQLTNTDQSKVKDTTTLNTTTITEKHQKIYFASSKDDPIDFMNKDLSSIHPSSSDQPAPNCITELMTMNDMLHNNNTMIVANTTSTLQQSYTSPPQSISCSSSIITTNDNDVKSKCYSIMTKNTESAASLLLNFARSHDPEPMITLTSNPTVQPPQHTLTSTTILSCHKPQPPQPPVVVMLEGGKRGNTNMTLPSPSKLLHTITQQHQVTDKPKQQLLTNNSFLPKKTGVFFRKDSINFGSVMIGSLTRANLELCNSTNDEVIVYLGDPKLPFVLLHNEVTLRAKSYVRVPVRYLPVNQGEVSNELIAQTDDGCYHTKIILMGNAY